jgi:hypothetical protein
MSVGTAHGDSRKARGELQNPDMGKLDRAMRAALKVGTAKVKKKG